MSLGLTQPLTEMSTRNLPGVKVRPACKADNLTAICVENVGAPTSQNTMGFHDLLTGIALPSPRKTRYLYRARNVTHNQLSYNMQRNFRVVSRHLSFCVFTWPNSVTKYPSCAIAAHVLSVHFWRMEAVSLWGLPIARDQ
jgi:hypothetical protein